MSRLRVLPFVYTADLPPFSSQESTYLVGSKRVTGGPTSLINKSAETVLVRIEALVGVIIKFICENPCSRSLEEIGIVFKACCRGSNFSGISFGEVEVFSFTKGQIITEVTWPVFLI